MSVYNNKAQTRSVTFEMQIDVFTNWMRVGPTNYFIVARCMIWPGIANFPVDTLFFVSIIRTLHQITSNNHGEEKNCSLFQPNHVHSLRMNNNDALATGPFGTSSTNWCGSSRKTLSIATQADLISTNFVPSESSHYMMGTVSYYSHGLLTISL